MYKIGEFSKIVQLTVKTLRYYDEVGLLAPAHIDEENGYRYYNDENFEKVMWIKTLKKHHFTIKEIQEVILNIEKPEDLFDYLLEKNEQLSDQIKHLRKAQKSILSDIELYKEANTMEKVGKVEVVTIDEKLVASVRYKGKYQDVGIYLGKLYKHVGMKGQSAPFSMYYDEEYTEENADIEVCVEVKDPVNKGEVTSRKLPSQKCVAITHYGPYETLSSSYKAISDYMQENNLEGLTPSREIYEKGPGMLFKGNPKKYETRILIPIK